MPPSEVRLHRWSVRLLVPNAVEVRDVLACRVATSLKTMTRGVRLWRGMRQAALPGKVAGALGHLAHHRGCLVLEHLGARDVKVGGRFEMLGM